MGRNEIDFLPQYADEALLDELRRIAALLPRGALLTRSAYRRHRPKVMEATLRRRFGGWKETLEKAGLGRLYAGQSVSQKIRTHATRNRSKADFLVELKRVHALVGKPFLTWEDFTRHSVTTAQTVRGRFGSFLKALEAAGIPKTRPGPRRFTTAIMKSPSDRGPEGTQAH